MRKSITSRVWRLSIVVVLLFTLFGLTLSAQEPEPPELELHTFEVGAPTLVEFEWGAEPPTLTEEQQAQLEWGIENTHRPGPARDGQAQAMEIAGPVPGTESLMLEERTRSGGPLAPGDAQRYKFKNVGPYIPDPAPPPDPPYSTKSNVMESSAAMAGVYGFYTGNWFAARSNGGGSNWIYTSPWTGMPDFCCDQITIYDEARDIFLWLRMGIPDANGENSFKLGVSHKYASSWLMYDVPSFWPNEWWDYPHIQLGAQYMYLSWNVFDQYGWWTRTVMLMIPLDDLAAGNPIPISWASTYDYFTWVPVQGAYHVMYWASNWGPDPNGIGIWSISEDFISSGGATGFFNFDLRHVPQWSFDQAHCPLSGYNWLGRTDDRLLTGARYSIYSDGVVDERIPGRKVVAWWWNVAEDPTYFPLPYIDGAAFFEDDLTLLPGWLGRPYMWGGDYYCFGYPSITPNKRQDLGAIFNFARAGLDWAPRVGYSMADDYVHAPPGWIFYQAWNSRALPSDNRWGDYNTLREYEPTQKAWMAAAHVIRQTAPCTNCGVPIYFVFGRERDYQSWFRWRVK